MASPICIVIIDVHNTIRKAWKGDACGRHIPWNSILAIIGNIIFFQEFFDSWTFKLHSTCIIYFSASIWKGKSMKQGFQKTVDTEDAFCKARHEFRKRTDVFNIIIQPLAKASFFGNALAVRIFSQRPFIHDLSIYFTEFEKNRVLWKFLT